MNDQIKVSICMLAYNHEKYIRQALDSILMQKVDFNYEILIHDDASLDKTADIIKEYEEKYPNIIKPIYQVENQFSKGKMISREYQYPRVSGQYVAFCECDDYWIDAYKLQKQVNFLDKNPKIFSTAHKYMIVDKIGNFIKYSHEGIELNKYFTKNDALKYKNELFHPNTIMFRSEILKEKRFFQGFDECCILGGHTYMIYYFLQKSDIYIMNECMSVWRKVIEKDGTSYSSRADRHRITYNIKLLDMYCRYNVFFKNEYNFDIVIRKMLLICIKIILRNNEEGIDKITALKECFKLVSVYDIFSLPYYELKRRLKGE